MPRSKDKTNLIIILSAVIIATPLMFYIYKFSQNKISTQNEDWANFSSFFSSFIALATLIVFVYFTQLVYRYSIYRDKILDDLERPVISFSKISELDKYSIENIGKGAALNIEVKSHLDKAEFKWGQKGILYSFAWNNFLASSNRRAA